MFLHRPARDSLRCFQIHNRHRSLRPQADVKALALFIESARVGKGVAGSREIKRGLLALCGHGVLEIRRGGDGCEGERAGVRAENYVAGFRFTCEVNASHAIAPDVGNEESFRFRINGKSGGHGAQFRIVKFDGAAVGELPLGEFKRVNHLGTRATAEELAAIAGEFEPVKRRRNFAARNQRGGFEIEHTNFMRRESAVENRRVTSTRMHGEIDRKVTERNLLADRMERPFVGQQHRAVGFWPG